MASTDLAHAPTASIGHPAVISGPEVEATWRVAKALTASGMFKDVRQAEQAFAKILIGRDLGISATQAMSGIDLVRGNVQMRAVLLASFVRKSADYDYEMVEHTDEMCAIRFVGRSKRDGEWRDLGVSAFTIEDAKQAGIYKNDSPWKAHPRNMVFARAMSNGVKWYCPDLLGGVPVYTEADTFAEQIGADQAAYDDSRVQLPQPVAAIVERAQSLGHAGLSDKGAAEVATSGQSPEYVSQWVIEATDELDRYEATVRPPEVEDADDGEVVTEASPLAVNDAPLSIEQHFRDRLERLTARIVVAQAQGDDEALAELSAEFDALQAEMEG